VPRIIDISPLVSERLAVFPGDVPYRRQASRALACGDDMDLSAVQTTLHLGAHADAPAHVLAGGAGIAARPLDLYYGSCQVVRVGVAPGSRIAPADVEVEIAAARVLFRTDTCRDAHAYDPGFAGLGTDLVEFLARRGVRLVGIDTPSVDPHADGALLAHRALAARDMAILEGLVLAHVEPGLYTLVALPLRLEGADASPVRAVLVEATPEFPA
jgi:arylformamidase